MRFVKIELLYKDKAQGSYIDRINKVNLVDLLDGMEPGADSYRVSVIEMSKVEFEKLPEFIGF